MRDFCSITQAHYAIGYACTCAWAVILLIAPVFDSLNSIQTAPLSMLPGLVTCLASLLFPRRFPSIAGRTNIVTLSAFLVALGSFLCTFPSMSAMPLVCTAGLILSGMFAIVLIMAWFDIFARLTSRAIIILSGCSISIAALMSWGILSCDATLSSVLFSLLPLLSLILLPTSKTDKHTPHTEKIPADENHASNDDRAIVEIVAAALPARTLIGLAITFFVVNSLGTLAPSFANFSSAVTPLLLLIPLGASLFFIASALIVQRNIDPSILYKVLMFAFAAIVLLLTFPIGINASLVFCVDILAEVMIWTVLALLAKKTPVRPHHVFAIGWIAECIGSTLGQSLYPVFEEYPQAFLVVTLMLIFVAVGFAFSERSLVLDVGFEEDGRDSLPDNASSATKIAADTVDTPQATSPDTQTINVQKHAAVSPAAPKATNTANAQEKQKQKKETVPASAKTDSETVSEPHTTRSLDAFVQKYDISRRERDVLELWLAGRGLKFIENALFISESTVKSHLRSIYRKCDTHSRDEIISLYEKTL